MKQQLFAVRAVGFGRPYVHYAWHARLNEAQESYLLWRGCVHTHMSVHVCFQSASSEWLSMELSWGRMERWIRLTSAFRKQCFHPQTRHPRRSLFYSYYLVAPHDANVKAEFLRMLLGLGSPCFYGWWGDVFWQRRWMEWRNVSLPHWWDRFKCHSQWKCWKLGSLLKLLNKQTEVFSKFWYSLAS